MSTQNVQNMWSKQSSHVKGSDSGWKLYLIAMSPTFLTLMVSEYVWLADVVFFPQVMFLLLKPLAVQYLYFLCEPWFCTLEGHIQFKWNVSNNKGYIYDHVVFWPMSQFSYSDSGWTVRISTVAICITICQILHLTTSILSILVCTRIVQLWYVLELSDIQLWYTDLCICQNCCDKSGIYRNCLYLQFWYTYC